MSDEKKPTAKELVIPQTLTHLRSYPPPKASPFDTTVKGPVNWKYWRHVATVELWQALLLSLNIEPPGNGRLLENSPDASKPGNIPYEYMDSHGLTDEFISRWKLLRNRLETLFAANGKPSEVQLIDFITLLHFATWAVEFEWEGLPPELVALAQKPDKQTDAPAAGKVEVDENTNQSNGDWIVKARTIADSIGLKRWELGIRQINPRNICEGVAEELGKDKTTWGKQGPRGADNVRNAGLRGWEFTPPMEAPTVD